jgi:type IX secretion system PorP/SprF family membrane protein
MLKRIVVACLAAVAYVTSIGEVRAQDPQFSQFYANPLYLNPAFAGAKRCPRLIMNYRNQWPSISGTFVTYSASFDMHIDKMHGGLGGLFMADRAGEGTLNTFQGSLMYAYQLNVTRKFTLRFAVEGALMQRSLDWGKLTFGDMIDPRYGFIYPTQEVQPTTSRIFFDLNAGFIGYTENIYFGFAAHHLTEPDEGFGGVSKLPRKWTGHAGFNIHFGRKGDKGWMLSPNIVYQHQQDFQQFNYGFYLAKSFMVGGIWFRHSFVNADALIFLVGFQQGAFKFGYSYDVTVSSLSNSTGGSHELSLGLQFNCRKAKKKFRAVSCPSF